MFQPNSVIAGRYQVIRLVGQGGMSNLYLAYDRKYNNAIVVVKEMTAAYSDPKEQQMAVELFHREAKLLASLNHRHIPKVYDYFQFAGKYYLSMEFIDGEDLAQKLEATKGPLPEAQVLEWGEQIATVLFYLHKHEPPIVFRDVKPSNIMLCDQGVKLIDFGIARHFDQAKKGDTMRIGSPGYAPPEQYAAQTDPRSDIYALGVTLHHALTGRDPTATQTPFLVPPARNLNPALSEATAAMLARATQLDPADRYQNVLEMKNDIKQILSRGKQSTRVVGAPPALPTSPTSAAPPANTPVSTPASVTSPTAATAASPSTASASASPPAATSATNSGSAVAPAASTPATTAATPPPSQGGRSAKRFLLAAFVLILLGGGAFAIGPEGRQSVVLKTRTLLDSLSKGSDSGSSDAIANAIEDAFRKGDPGKLFSLLSNAQMAGLSSDKQALYHLNLLAAKVAPEAIPPQMLHVLYPESFSDKEEEALFRTCAVALAAINGAGGLDKQLLVVLPKPYTAGKLNATISKLSASPLPKGGQRLLVIDPAAEASQLGQETLNQPLFLVGEGLPEAGIPHLNVSFSASHLGTMVTLPADSSLLWAATGEPPTKNAVSVNFDGSPESLKTLLQRSASEKAPLVVEASRVSGLEGTAFEGRLLLLAIGSETLPKLAPGSKADALVLGSPIRSSHPKAPLSSLCLSPEQNLEPLQARYFDSIVLAASTEKLGYLGVTVTRSSDGKEQPGLPVRFRWTDSGWVPVVE